MVGLITCHVCGTHPRFNRAKLYCNPNTSTCISTSISKSHALPYSSPPFA